MNGMLTAANIDFRSTGGKLANSHISASPVNRLSEEIYSQQAAYICPILYRYLNLDYQSGSGAQRFEIDLDYTGPMLGVSYRM